MEYNLIKKIQRPFFYSQDNILTNFYNETINLTGLESSTQAGASMDINKYKELQAALKESEANYKNLFNNVDIGCALYQIVTNEAGEAIDYIITEANMDFEVITGLDRLKIIGKKATEIFSGMEHLLVDKIKLFGEVAATGKSVSMEYYSNRTNGWYSVICHSPKPGYTASIFSNITTRKNNEEELKKTRQRLLEAQEFVHIGDWEVDVLKNHHHWADEIFRIYGYKPQEFIPVGDSYLRFIHPEDREYVENSMPDLGSGVLDSLEYRYIGKNNKTGWLNIKVKTVYDNNGNLIKLHGIVQDVTDRVTMEKDLIKAKDLAEKASNTKSEFIANMSHELRTPINVVFGAIQLFEMYIGNGLDLNKERFSMHLKSMKQNCLRLSRLVNNLIDTTKIDSGFYSPTFNTCNIVGLIKEISLSVSEYAKYRNIELVFESNMEMVLTACDVDMIERIMLNLISNAIKFTKDFILISISKIDDNILIKVKDNGIGIEEANQDIIFERYKQVSELLTRENEGSGIGLSIAKALVEMHDGNISVKSDYGKSCEFIIELPIKSSGKKDITSNSTNYPSDNNHFIEKMIVEFSDIYK
jgi:PAS domain S-box-containing protein